MGFCFALPIKYTGMHWSLALDSRSKRKQDFTHWSWGFLQALCAVSQQIEKEEKNGPFPISLRRLCVCIAGKEFTVPLGFAQSFLDPYPCCSCSPCCWLLPTHQFRFLLKPREMALEQLTCSHFSFHGEWFLKQLQTLYPVQVDGFC